MRAKKARPPSDLGPMPGSRRLGLVLPVVLAMVDALVVLSLIAEGLGCDAECASTVLVRPFTPLFGPLALAGIGGEGDPSLGAVALAYLVTFGLIFAWWWFVTNRVAAWARGSVLRFLGGYLMALVVTGLIRAVFFPVQDAAGSWVASVVEIPVAALVLWCFSRFFQPRER
ncbi:MAG: hypothetical protein ACR2KK_19585 [Acidimicrobiales bacterium]